MKRIAGMIAVLAVFSAVMVHGQEAQAPVSTVELTGTVVVMKDDAGMIKSALLKTGEGEEVKLIAINLDTNGKELVVAAGENTVKVTGVIAEANGLSKISVSKFEVVKKAESVEVEGVEAEGNSQEAVTQE